MDTSDSEHFESADEFNSDSESSEDSAENSVVQDGTKIVEKSLNNLNINDHSKDTTNQCEKNETNSSSICRDTEGNRTDELQARPHVKHDSEDNQIISKRITKFNSLVEAQVDNVKQDVEAQYEVEKQQLRNSDSISETASSISQDEFNIIESKKHKSDSIAEGANEHSQKSGSDNMWDNDEWEPIAIENVDSSGGKDNKSISIASNAIEENLWDNDDWEPIDNKDNYDSDGKWQKDENKKVVSSPDKDNSNVSSWSGWGTWGVSSILSTATHGVSTLTNQVSQGLSNVLENGMGIPNPEELAKQHHNEQEKILPNLEHVEQTCVAEEELENKNYTGFGFGNLSNLVSGVSNLTRFVEHTGTKVITGGLDTLETIGKKTMEVLQDGDPGLKNKRAFLKLDQDKPVLSQVLREAKAKAEEENKALKHNDKTKMLNYESLFDDYHGLVHLEALEMLSKQCDIKLQSLSDTCTGDTLKEILETLEQVRELCELPDEDDEDQSTLEDIEEKIESALKEININISYDKGISTWKEADDWLNRLQLGICEDTEIHQEALQVLAQLTAIAVEQFHKAGELLLIKEHRSTADEADSLVQLTTALTSLIGIAAGKFSEKLNAKATGSLNKEIINDLITNVFFEAANSSSYIQDAFQLLIPVLQVGAV